jgi:Mg/Co/Ni transporter MgtE
MKKEMPAGIILGAVLLALAIVGYIIYQGVKTPDVSVPDSTQMRNRMVQKYQGGSSPSPGSAPTRPASSAPAPPAPKP